MGKVTPRKAGSRAQNISFSVPGQTQCFNFSNVPATVALIRALSRVKNNNLSKAWKSESVHTCACLRKKCLKVG